MERNKVLIIIGILVVIVIGVALIGSKEQSTPPVSKEQPVIPAIAAIKGKLSFDPTTGQFPKGEIFPVNIMVDSNGQSIAGADIMIKYDPSILEVKAQNGNLVEAEKDFFAVFPAEGQTKDNLFQFSVLTQTPKVINGKVATVYFSAKKAGEAKLEFLFEEGKTNDSNLALAGQGSDILASVVNAIFKILK